MCKISKNVLKCISGLDCLYDFKEWREKMRFVIQRVNNAKVTVDGNVTGSIGKGLLIFFGAGQNDTEDMLEKFKDKIVKLRIFADKDGKTNLSVKDVDGEVLIVSQFTLYADCRNGNRPSFAKACEPVMAERMYENLIELFKKEVKNVETGIFGADMKVQLENDGPFTICLDSDDFGF